MEKQITTVNAVQYRINSAIGPNGQGIALTFTVCSPDGRTEQQWPPIFVPSANAAQLAQGILSAIAQLKSATQ